MPWTREYRDDYYRKTYGITIEQYEQMLSNQQGRCFICRRPSKVWLHVDHDHVTGHVRKLLCAPCNHAVGFVERAGLRRIIRYLRLEAQTLPNFTPRDRGPCPCGHPIVNHRGVCRDTMLSTRKVDYAVVEKLLKKRRTLQSIADEFGVSRQRIHQIKKSLSSDPS